MHTAYRDIGGFGTRVLTIEGAGIPILLLHGFSDHAAGWRPFMTALESHGIRAVAVDLPGFGRADGLRPGPMLPQLADFTTEAVRLVAREYGAPVVVGNSLGGASIWQAAQDHRLPLAGLVTIAPAGFGFTRPVRAFRQVHRVVPSVLAVPPLPMPLLRAALVHIYAHAAGPGRRLDPDVGRAWVDQFPTRSDLRRTLDLVQRVLLEIDDVGDLPLPPYPVMMIWGGRDRLVRSTRSSSEFQGAETLTLKRAGHCPQLQDAETLAEHVLAFAKRLPAAGNQLLA